MVNISIVQGRLSSMVGTRYQHFPTHAWREEFKIASQIGFDGIEWIISDFSNPIFDINSLEEVKVLSDKTGVLIDSISLDVLMYNPIHSLSWDDIYWLFERLCIAVKKLKVLRVSIPIEENSGIHDYNDATEVIARLKKVLNNFSSRIPFICIETDLSPKNIYSLINLSGLSKLGVLIDLGNIASNGYRLDDYFKLFSNKIYGVHIKDRGELFVPKVPFGKGVSEIKLFLDRYDELKNLTSITLQSFRSPDKYIENAKFAFKYVKEHIQ